MAFLTSCALLHSSFLFFVSFMCWKFISFCFAKLNFFCSIFNSFFSSSFELVFYFKVYFFPPNKSYLRKKLWKEVSLPPPNEVFKLLIPENTLITDARILATMASYMYIHASPGNAFEVVSDKYDSKSIFLTKIIFQKILVIVEDN